MEPSTIDDVVKDENKAEAPSPKAQNPTGGLRLDSRLKSTGNELKSFGGALAAGGIVAATYGLVGRSSLLTSAGNGVGYLIEKIKSREKIKTGELAREVATGGIMGTVGYALYSMIDFIPNYSIPLKIVKTLAFNPIMLAPYVAFYQAFTYLRDKVGIGKSIGGVFNLKIFKYLKDSYQNEIKPNFKGSMKKVMYLMPIHFASINYVREVWKRVGIGVFNDIVFRLFQGRKEKQKPQNYSKTHNQNMPYATKPAYS